MNKVINFGSLNIDHVYRVGHIVHPGETILSHDYHMYCGGKGANQSVALARAGAHVRHAGCVGKKDGAVLVDNLSKSGVDVSGIVALDIPSGHAVIQVDDGGENAIFLFPGANHALSPAMVEEVLSAADAGDIILLQNEINNIGLIMEKAAAAGLKLCLNFAPFDIRAAAELPLHLLSFLIVNETEGEGLSGCSEPGSIIDSLRMKYPEMTIILTLGPDGAIASAPGEMIKIPSPPARVVDTTSAGDTFIGYFLAAWLRGCGLRECCTEACAAAAVTVSRPGAVDSIPCRSELNI